MRKRNRSTSTYVALAFATVAVAATALPAGAQDWTVRRAESMEDQAQALEELKPEWKRAAWYYREAASARPEGDAEAVIDLHMAGKLSFYVGDLDQSLDDLEAAGRRAMEGGDVLTSGSLLVDAAWVAGKLGRDVEARDWILEAREILASTVLSDAVRNTVLARIDSEAATVTVAADFSEGPAG